MKDFICSAFVLVLISYLFGHCHGAYGPHGTDAALEAKLKKANRQFELAYNVQGKEKWIRLFTKDARIMLPGYPMLSRRKDLRKAFDLLKGTGVATLKMKMVEFGGIAKGELVFQRGEYVFYDTDGKKIDDGKFLTIHRNVKGRLLKEIGSMSSNSKGRKAQSACQNNLNA